MNNQSKFSVDDKAASCQVCRSTKFSIIKRRYLCCKCGKTICANCGIASANTFMSNFRKKDRESNICIKCQRLPPAATTQQSATQQPQQPPPQAQRSTPVVSAQPTSATTGSQVSTQQNAAAAAATEHRIPSQKPLPPSERSDATSGGHVESAGAFVGMKSRNDTGRYDTSECPTSIPVETPPATSNGGVGLFAPPFATSKQVDWTATSCRLCCRGFTTDRRRLLCSTCGQTVCSSCMQSHGHQQGDLPTSVAQKCNRCVADQQLNSDAMRVRSGVGSFSTMAVSSSSSALVQQQPALGPSVKQAHGFAGSMLGRSVMGGAGGASFAVGSSLLAGGAAHGTSFRPASILRRAAPGGNAGLAVGTWQRRPPAAPAAPVKVVEEVVEVGSVRPTKQSVAGGPSSFAASSMRRAALGPRSTAVNGAVGSVRNMSMALVLGTTPMGSLPAHFFQLRKKQLGLLPGSTSCSTVALLSSESQSQFLDVCAAVPPERRVGLDKVVYIADIVGSYLARDHLRVSVDLLLERHPLLRCGLIENQFHVYPSATADFRFISASNVGTTFAAAERLFLTEISKPFETASATSLLRVRLLDRSSVSSSAVGQTPGSPKKPATVTITVALVFHRAIASSSDVSLFINDLKTLYQHANTIVEKNTLTGECKIRYDTVQRVLPQLPSSFDNFSRLEQEFLSDPTNAAAAAARQFWVDAVDRRVPLEFPIDHPRAPSASMTSSIQPIALTNAVSNSLALLSKACGVPAKTAVLGVFHMLVLRYTQQETVTMAVQPLLDSAQHLEDFKDTFGPLRDVQLFYSMGAGDSPSTTCAQYVRDVQQALYAAERHARFPHRQRFAHQRNNNNNVFDLDTLRPAQVCFTEQPSEVASFLLHTEGSVTPFAGLEWRSSARYRQTLRRSSMFELELHYWEVRGRIHLALEYNVELFQSDTINRFIEDFLTALRHASEGGGTKFTPTTLPCVSPAMTQKLLFDFNANNLDETAPLLGRGRGVLGLWESALPTAMSALALSMPSEQFSPDDDDAGSDKLTYEQLEAKSNMIAHYLRQTVGAGSGSVVAIAMERCVTQLVCVLGILKSGAAYLPLDISYPADRLEFMLNDSKVACVFTSRATKESATLAPLFQSCSVPVLPIVDEFDSMIAAEWKEHAGTTPDVDIDPADACYVIYTSGSTGKPKGVVQNHRALTNLVLWQNSYLPSRTSPIQSSSPLEVVDVTPGSLRVLQFSPISFDVSFQELFTTLSVGGTLYMVSETLRLDPQRLIRFMNHYGVHRIFLPFVALSHICETAVETEEYPATLVDIVTAGEQLVISRPLIECLERMDKALRSKTSVPASAGGVVVHNHYGPSETHVCSYYTLSGNPHHWASLPPIGKPISNTQLYVLDDKRQLLPLGAVGELFISGDCLGTGYLGREDATEAAFVDCPFASASSAKMYKTGDLVQLKPDGNILYVRRKDTQVKVRGFRIELGEIEARLGQSEHVKKCCVVVRDDGGSKTIVAYVVGHATPSQSPATSIGELKAFLATTMPAYMVPAVFVFLPTLPLTPSGKINRKGLPPPTETDVLHSSGVDAASGGTSATSSSANAAPETAMQVKLARIWEDVLKRPAGTVATLSSNFFDMGGHSLTITKVASRVALELRKLQSSSFAAPDIPLSEYFKHPTLGEQAAMIDKFCGVVATTGNTSTAVPNASSTPLLPDESSTVSLETEAAARAAEAEAANGEDNRIPLTYNQQSLAYLCFLRPDAAAVYNISMQGKLVHNASNVESKPMSPDDDNDHTDGDVSAADIAEAFEKILRSHASLRTTYHQDENGVFYQRIHENQELDFNVVQLGDEEDEFMGGDDVRSGLPSSTGLLEEETRELILAESVRPFNLSADSLLRVRLYIRGSTQVLQIVLHHIAVDLWSIDLMFDEWIGLMGGQRRGLPSIHNSESTAMMSRRGPAAATYAEYSHYQLLQEETGVFSRSSVAWKRALDVATIPRELAVLDLPTDYPRPLQQTFTGGMKSFQLPQSLTNQLRALVKQHGTTLYVTLMSIVSIVLHKYSRQDEILLGTPMACRTAQRFEQTVGYFINAIPIRTCFRGNGQTASDVLGACTEYLLNALEHQDYPFPLIADRIVGASARSSSRTPVFQALFTFQSAPLHQELIPFVMFQDGFSATINDSISWESIGVPTGHSMYDLVFQFGEVNTQTSPSSAHVSSPPTTTTASPSSSSQILGTIEYNSDLFSAATIDNFIQVIEWTAEQICCHKGDIPIAKISTAPPSHQTQQIKAFNEHPQNAKDAEKTIVFGDEQHGTIPVRLSRPDEAHFVKVFSETAKRQPNLPAIEFGYPPEIPGGIGSTITTFKELDDSTNQIARVLLQKCPELRANTIVGVSIRRSTAMLQTMIAVMKTGAAYVPIDPGYPADRIEYMAQDADCNFIVCRAEDAQEGGSLASLSHLRIITLEEILAAATTASVEPLDDVVSKMRADDLAYVIYTSGSTGKPKGTLLEHRGLVNLCWSIQFGYHMKYGKSKFLLFASSSFDASVLELFAPLALASCVVMLSSTTIVGETLAKAMQATKITTAVLPPSVLSVMTEDFFPPSTLEVLVTAGEAINDELLQRWRGKICMLNGYGPTENTVCSTVCDYDADGVVVVHSHQQYLQYRDDTDILTHFAQRVQQQNQHQKAPARGGRCIVKQPPIGRPLANYRCYVVDESLQLVGTGVPGELIVSGPGVARGYHRLPERTAQSFIPNPFHPDDYPRMYKTGDLVRWVGDGLLEFLGRIDQQVKLRGYRIELGEVEAAILKFQESKAFADCAVELKTVGGIKCLVAYVVAAAAAHQEEDHGVEGEEEASVPPATTALSIQELKAFLKTSLPDYMVPARFVMLRSLPLTPSGKVDRKNLPTPASEDETSDAGAGDIFKAAPQTPTEAVLLVLAKEVLGSSVLGIDDDFFESGGHSLAAMQLVARIRDHLGMEVSVAKLFELPKLVSLAAFIDASQATNEEPIVFSSNHLLDDPGSSSVVTSPSSAYAPPAAAISAASTTSASRFPLSFNQESLWFAYTIDKTAATFNVTFSGKCVGGTFDEVALAKAMRAIVILNPMLRSIYSGEDATPQQWIKGDVRDVRPIQGTLTKETTLEDYLHEPLDLEAGEVFRVLLLSNEDDEAAATASESQQQSSFIAFVFHHIVSDLSSMETFIRQFTALYTRAATPSSDLYRMNLDDFSTASSMVKRRIANDVGDALGGIAGASYIDFVYYQRELMASPKGERLLNYWRRQLSGYPAFTALPTDFVRPAHPSLRGGAAIGNLSVSTVERVVKASRQFGTTPLTVYLTALFGWLFRVTGQTDVVVGMPVSNRTRSELQNVVGDFVNLCPIRLQLDEQQQQQSSPGDESAEVPSSSSPSVATAGGVSFQMLARKAKASLLGALMHQEYPFQLTVQNLQQYRDPSRSPIFQVLLVHEKTHHSMTQISPFILGDAGGSLSFGPESGEGSERHFTLDSVATAERTCSYDLVFALSEGENGRVDFRIQYAKDLFKEETVQRFAAQYVALLEAAIVSPLTPVEKLSMIPTEEVTFLEQRNRSSRLESALSVRDVSSNNDSVTLHTEFEATVAKFGSHRALFDTLGVSYTYNEMNVAANIIARRIRHAATIEAPEGLRQPQSSSSSSSSSSSPVKLCDLPVCIFMPRSVDYVITVVAAAKSNCPYTPIDIKIPAARASYIISDTACVAVLTSQSQLETLTAILDSIPATSPRPIVIVVDEVLKAGAATKSDEENLENTSRWDDCLYTIYTSGSTGMPKGVRVHHAGVVNVCRWFEHEHRVVPGDISAQALGSAFDPVTIELWPYFLAGAAVVIMDDDSKFGGPEATLAFLDKYQVTHLTFPTVLSQLIFDNTATYPVTLCVRSWSCGGDKFKGTNKSLPFALINAYGPTECCVLCSQYPINYPVRPRHLENGEEEAACDVAPPEAGRLSVDPPLGEPTANTALYVLDTHGNLVPRGVVGELCVGGAQVGIGYRNRPDATASAFTNDVFEMHSDLARQPARLYHTGDLVKMDHDYNIHFVGRRDFQVKIRGFRIELGEIESQLLNVLPEIVGHAVCLAYEPPTQAAGDSSGEKKLVAFVKVRDTAAFLHPSSPQETDESKSKALVSAAARQYRADIRSKLKSRLPDYMVPPLIIFLATFPLTPNGKVDRAQLPQLIGQDLCGSDDGDGTTGGEGAAAKARFVPPVTRDEQTLCTIWEELLRTKPIGLTDDWYDKGGSSLTSTMLLSRMRQVFQMEITLQQFFGDPTVTGLLNIIKEKGNSTVAHSLTNVLEHDACDLDPAITAVNRVVQSEDDDDQELLIANPLLLRPYDAKRPPSCVFITGVTGFLGAFILKHFLEALPEARMYCLVRGKSETDASSRIFSNLMQYQLFDDCHDVDQWMSRVVPIVGDLAQDHFGLSVARFHELAAVVDCIVHNGALVNFSYPYVSLKAANVGGTVTALKLATTYRLKPVHFISTLSTVPTPDVAGTRTVSERLLGPASEDLHGGYTQTKWVAERLVTLATTSRNIPCTIIRPGRITGHSATGACNLDDFLNLFIKGCVEMAAIPEVEMPCEMTPVDFCAQAIFDIATKHFEHFASSSKRCPAIAPAASPIIAPQFIYHLTNTSSMAWSQIMKIVCRQGNYGELTTKPYVAWRHEHLLALNSTTHCALIPLVPMFGENFEEEMTPLDVRVDHLDELLKYSGTVCPPTSEALVMSYVKYFLERGFLPSVAGTAFSTQHQH